MKSATSKTLFLDLVRRWLTSQSTIGELKVDGKRVCYVLEDVVRPDKVYGKTAIPQGEYEVLITWSPRFQRMLPILVDVPNYQGVRIHPGNTADDTEGCLLPGTTRLDDRVGESRKAFEKVFALIEGAIKRGDEVRIRISQEKEKKK